MDNNNIPNNNQAPDQNGYNNINQYPTQPPVQQPAPGQIPYTAFSAQPDNSNDGKALGIISIICSLLGCCCGPASIVGIVLGIIGVSRNKKSTVSIVGLVLGAVMCVLWIISFIYQLNHPEISDSLNQMLESFNY